jgi:hypothetical protein
LRNVGSSPSTVTSVYLGGISLTTGASTLIAVGSSKLFTLTGVSGSYTTGAAYTLKIVSATGGVFAFSVIDGSAG